MFKEFEKREFSKEKKQRSLSALLQKAYFCGGPLTFLSFFIKGRRAIWILLEPMEQLKNIFRYYIFRKVIENLNAEQGQSPR